MSSAARAPSVEELMGYHLQADVAHDFGGDAPVYNIGGAGALTRVGAPNTSEDGALNYFIGPSPRGLPNVTKDLVARLGQQVIFTVPDKTASFQNWKAPVLFQGGNDKIGVVQDAGEFITQRIGAKNVITFGSILDPAGKPIAPDQEPIWFQPSTNSVTISLAPFGFDPNVIKSIVIKDLTAGTVKSEFNANNKVIDAVAMSPPVPVVSGGKPKPINNTDIAKAGFFTSIKKAENVGRELQASGVKPDAIRKLINENSQYFFIGKTLGDAMLVASAMPGFPGNIPNPYYGIGATTGWKSWVFADRTVASPSLLCLKTGDRLNWLRAVLLNVPAIYEDQAKGGRKIKQYKFIPGLADPAAIKAAILSDFDALIPSIAERYNGLTNSLGNLLNQTDNRKIDRAKTNFAPGGSKEISSVSGDVLAGRVVREIRTRLGAISKRVTDWVAKQKTVASAIPATNTEQLRKVYQTTLDRANACAPQTSTIFIAKGKQDPYLSSKLIVANVPAGVKQGEWPLTTSIDIALRNAFSNFNRAPDTQDATYKAKIAGTDIQNRFFAKVDAMKLGARRGGGPEDLLIEEADDGAPLIAEGDEGPLIEEETVDEVIPDVPLDTASIETEVLEVVGGDLDKTKGIDVDDPTIPVQTGGGFLTPSLLRDDETEWPIILESFPRTADFLSYLASKGINTLKGIVLIYDIIRRRTTNRIVDPYLLEELVQEFSLLLGYKKTGEPEPPATPYIAIQGADLSVFSADYMIPQTTPSSTATVMFDAYTYFVNARNASEFGTEEIVTQSVRDYEMYEQKYLALLGTMVLRSGQQLLPAESTVAVKKMGPKKSASSGKTPEQKLKEFQQRSEKARMAKMEERRIQGMEPPQEGGLRDRRPLYAKNVRSSGTLGDDDGGDNQGLWKRSRARTTPRVRKHSRNSKTRRQRKHVDRV